MTFRHREPQFSSASIAGGTGSTFASDPQAVFAAVRKALVSGRAVLAYQPIVIADQPDRIAFFEALIRIPDPDGGLLPARDFMPLCEVSDIGRDIDCLALKLSLDALSRAPALNLAVNMSARTIGHSKWRQVLHSRLNEVPELADRLIVEITETSALPENEVTRNFMSDLRALGIRFALDDFGTGHTSFRQLKTLDFDILKIAGEFASNLRSDPGNRALTKAMVTIARQFGITTVAEAVETDEDASALAEAGIDGLQGYFFGRPSATPHWPQFQDGPRLAS